MGLLVMTIKLLSSTKLSKLSDQKVISNNTGTGHIKRPQLNGTLMDLVLLTTLPTVELKFNLSTLLDGILQNKSPLLAHQLLLCKPQLELDGLNSLDASLTILIFLLKLISRTLL